MNDKIFNNMMETFRSLNASMPPGKTNEDMMRDAFERMVDPHLTVPRSLTESPPDFKEYPEYIVFKSIADDSAKRVLAIGMHEDIRGLVGAGFTHYIPFPHPVDAPDEMRIEFEKFFSGRRGKGVQEKIAWETFQYAYEKLRGK
jgi:hypothetical protein